MEVDQDETILRGEDRLLEFTVPDAGTTPIAGWYLAPQRESLLSEHLLDLDTDAGGVELAAQGDDLVVTVTLTHDQTEAFEPGQYHHELWLEDALGNRVAVAEGTLTILDSLRN